MEIETSSMSISFDKLLHNYNFLSQIPIDQISKTIDKRMSPEILPPFIVVHFDSKEEQEIGFDQLLTIWNDYLNKSFPKKTIKFDRCNIFYITRYEDGIMIGKNQDDESIYFVGKFGLGEVVLFSYASSNVEKATRLKSLMTLYNSITQKNKQPEKKK